MNEKKQLLKEKIPILPLMDDLHNFYVTRTALNAKMVTHIHCPSDFTLYTNRELLTEILNHILWSTVRSVQDGCIRLVSKLDQKQQCMNFMIRYFPGDWKVLFTDQEGEIFYCRDLAHRLGGNVYFLGEKEEDILFELTLPLS